MGIRRLWLFLIAASALAADATMQIPADYREWVFLSSGLGMVYGPVADQTRADSPRFDNVFVSRPAYQAFLRTGQWPDKTTFVLEVRSSQSKGSINNGGHFQTGLAAVEMEVKQDGKWTFYNKEGNAFPRTATCYACHAQNGAVDNTFVQFYPTLLPVATQKGTIKK